MSPLICLVSPAHLASNPRLVKEADALKAAGYRVHVVCGRNYAPVDPFDAQIRSAASWTATVVDYTRSWRRLPSRTLHRLARRRLARKAAPTLDLAMRAQHPAQAALAAAARSIAADLYIGHTVAGLAAAALAARDRGVPYAFDAEDFHTAETDLSEQDGTERLALSTIERALLPGAAYTTAAAPLIARAYTETYGIPEPAVILNVFPMREAPFPPPDMARNDNAPRRFYWFSQTIGPGRGLESMVGVLAHLRTPSSLHLRGVTAPGFQEMLTQHARSSGYAGSLEFLPLAPSDQMAVLASTYDVGLSLEQTRPRNRDLCLTNKLFTYLLAGLPVACTPTSAQTDFARSLGDAALIIDLDHPEETARALDAFFADSGRLSRAAAAAWKAGQERFNWEHERGILLGLVAKALRGAAKES